MEEIRFLNQARMPIARPNDFFTEKLKSDGHMAYIKMRLLKQQQKIKAFEEKK